MSKRNKKKVSKNKPLANNLPDTPVAVLDPHPNEEQLPVNKPAEVAHAATHELKIQALIVGDKERGDDKSRPLQVYIEEGTVQSEEKPSPIIIYGVLVVYLIGICTLLWQLRRN